jgi:peroxiredoxin
MIRTLIAHTRRSACVLACLAAVVGTASAAPPVGEPAPDFALSDGKGRNYRLSEHAGDVVLLNFWASWVGPSRQEMAALDELYAKYQRAGLVMYGINLDDDAERALDMKATLAVDYPTLLDLQKRVAKAYDVSAMPLTVLIDREGLVRFVSTSYKPGDEREYAREVRQLLNE